ncbi:A-kinase anchor protein 8-like isoform X2 [Hyla sarda]|uniref:A-kinase anchor protein 8-like isoform X2 n=1 Tax=Hyla sarda TaxID=327740 RepID=UPI0024C3BD3F|nr:A-kinase anchor protein 8-like isoform X2 [Hyla sarda]
MYGRGRDGYMGRERDVGAGYGYGQDSYAEPWMSPYDGPNRRSYYEQPERSRYGYSEPERGYRGRRKQRPPHHAAPRGRGDRRGGFRGNFRPSRPARGARHPNHPPISDMEQFQQLKPFVDSFYFGGGFNVKNKRKGKWNKRFDGGQPPEKKMKTSAENSKSEEPGSEGGGNTEEPDQSTMNDRDQEAGTQAETEHTQSSSMKHRETQKEFMERTLPNRIQFFCSLCKFRTFYEDQWNNHLKTNLHGRHLSYLEKKLSNKGADFIQAYVENGYKKAKYHRKQVEDLNAKILQIHQSHDLTLGLGMDNYVKKVDLAHCDACDVFLPMHSLTLQEHIKSPSHRNNSKDMILYAKKRAFKTAMSILGDKRNKQRMEQFRKGENPFIYFDENIISNLAPEGKDSGEMACITLSDSEGEEEEDFQGQNSFINEEEDEEEEIRSHCSTEVVPETEESEQMPCSTPPDSKKDEDEEDCDGKVTEKETACVL